VYGQFDTGQKYIKVAVKAPNCEVIKNGGSHVKITVHRVDADGYQYDDSMIVPDHDLGIGLSCKIFKWFKMIGLLVIAGIAFYVGMIALGL
jgi:hypothetical protein